MCCVGACRTGARALMGGIRPMPGTSAGFVGESPASSKSSTASVCPSSSPQMARWSALYPSGPTAVGSAPGCASSMRRHLAHPPKADASNGVKPPLLRSDVSAPRESRKCATFILWLSTAWNRGVYCAASANRSNAVRQCARMVHTVRAGSRRTHPPCGHACSAVAEHRWGHARTACGPRILIDMPDASTLCEWKMVRERGGRIGVVPSQPPL